MMKIQFQIRGLKDDDQLRRQVEADLDDLDRLAGVTSAHVGLQHQREITPPYQAVAMLAVPGPDVHAAARDYTWPAAWRKVVARLREQIEQRQNRQTARQKSPPQIRRPGSRRAPQAAPPGSR